ncbi:hypothetical protein MPTK1_7g03250 [Marchantia polymorpha subsp. ruderalis]|uniref:RING-type E3 ubiquitin transferase n=2 Tax=Marchantia polymorpha TaxID=3197 RepID=A0AAF6BVN5_MARPO|nr:hypothetical protein MARPO_0074s0071 [Marchantia polymorpha]BBN16069.1 hypothetical protein Mp_7g03250 [Marchantia polymorpha subsp. ruderalis]|eukprot:PTQ35096.1 hypothetical protein MARPO_0074s0071 [Marchantia polymorpha]
MGQALRVSCGNTAGQQLFSAIREGDVEYVLQMLRDEPKLLNAGFFYERLAPLHVAAQQGQLQILQVLLERGAQVNILNSSGQTPLMLACKSGRWSCIEPLLEAGANVLAFDYTRARTCLHYASRGGHTECVRRILAAAAQGPVANSWGFVRFVNVRDGYGITPLHMASRQGHAGVLRLLLDSGALVSATTTTTGNGPGHGSTPIHCAARGGSLECVRELLAWGADRTQRDLTGYTPYGIAMKYNNTACAAILNPHGAEPLVWPSPWKFMSELEPEAKTLLEAALAQANDERDREMSSRSSRAQSTKSKGHTKRRTLAAVLSAPEADEVPAPFVPPARNQEEDKTEEAAKDTTADVPIETGGLGVQEVCCICFEQFCTIEVKECGHQMCATCTLSLCCHSKPNPAIPYSPPPSCPFCRRNIGHLIIARPKTKLQESKEKSRSRRSRRSGGSRHNSRGGSGGKGSFSGPLFSSRIISGRCGSGGRSGRIVDIDWLTRL